MVAVAMAMRQSSVACRHATTACPATDAARHRRRECAPGPPLTASGDLGSHPVPVSPGGSCPHGPCQNGPHSRGPGRNGFPCRNGPHSRLPCRNGRHSRGRHRRCLTTGADHGTGKASPPRSGLGSALRNGSSRRPGERRLCSRAPGKGCWVAGHRPGGTAMATRPRRAATASTCPGQRNQHNLKSDAKRAKQHAP